MTSLLLSGSQIITRKGICISDPSNGSPNAFYGLRLSHLERYRVRRRCKFCVYSRIKKGQKHEYPWPADIDSNLKTGHLNYLSHFKPLTEKPKPVTLDFEKPLVDLEKKIIDVRKMADETGLDFSDQINSLENKYQQALKDLYTHLTPIQRLSIARHPNRPTFLDHVLNITDKWVELHGDRSGYDDPAIVTGIGSMGGRRYMFIGHQKGRNTKENIQRNFGMPTPHGYRKALRMMKYADHHGFPIITFIDTPGAFADLKSEELGQGEAIAQNLRSMFGLRVPIVTVVIGEGGSGGALAIGCPNKLFMMENSVFYVASPEACAAILWKSSQAAPRAAEKLRITSTELCKLKIADGIIPEPLGGAHTDPAWTSQQIKLAVTKAMEELSGLDEEGILNHRHQKFRKLGGFIEPDTVEPERKRGMKKKEAGIVQTTAELEVEIENLRKKARESKAQLTPLTISEDVLDTLRHEVDKEMTAAFIAMGLQDKLEGIKLEISKSTAADLSPSLKERADKLAQEFNLGLSRPGAFLGLKQKLQTLTEANRLLEQRVKGERLKREVNAKLQGQIKGKMAVLKAAREMLARGELIDEKFKEEVETAKEELKELLESAKLEVVATGRKKMTTAPPELAEKIAEADSLISEEIQRAVRASGLKDRIEKLKEEMKGADEERAVELEKEIRESITAAMDLDGLKKKLEGLAVDPRLPASPLADNGRG
ncbi:acetyl Co-enzyme a carboxylase carboxyltransferase alpha subunit [Wolffia australiana]